MALALGVWSGSGKLFEVIYLLMWYISTNSRIPALDFMGILAGSADTGVSLNYLILTVVLLVLAAVGRRRQFLNLV